MNLGLQRKTDLALRALKRLGPVGTKLSGVALASSIGTTTTFLPQVVAPLIEHGWITSERGPGGGYSLTDASREVSIFDVVEATQGPTLTGRCVLRDQPCPGSETCDLHAVWTRARDVMVEGLQDISAVQIGERS